MLPFPQGSSAHDQPLRRSAARPGYPCHDPVHLMRSMTSPGRGKAPDSIPVIFRPAGISGGIRPAHTARTTVPSSMAGETEWSVSGDCGSARPGRGRWQHRTAAEQAARPSNAPRSTNPRRDSLRTLYRKLRGALLDHAEAADHRATSRLPNTQYRRCPLLDRIHQAHASAREDAAFHRLIGPAGTSEALRPPDGPQWTPSRSGMDLRRSTSHTTARRRSQVDRAGTRTNRTAPPPLGAIRSGRDFRTSCERPACAPAWRAVPPPSPRAPRKHARSPRAGARGRRPGNRWPQPIPA